MCAFANLEFKCSITPKCTRTYLYRSLYEPNKPFAKRYGTPKLYVRPTEDQRYVPRCSDRQEDKLRSHFLHSY